MKTNLKREKGHVIFPEERVSFIKKHLKGKVLDLGCRDGALTNLYIGDHEALGVDIDAEALGECNFPTRKMDLNREWPEGKFDTIVACEVVEHLFYPEEVFKRMRDSLNEGGVVIGSVPHGLNLQTRLKLLFGIKDRTSLGNPEHVNHFTVKELEGMTGGEVEYITSAKYRFLPRLFAHTLLFTFEK